MRWLAALIKFIFKAILMLVGVVLVAAIVTNLPTYFSPQADRLLIDTGSAWPFPPLNAEARALYPLLEARANEINTPLSNDPSLVGLTIAEGETAVDVADKLQVLGLISEAELFTQLLRYNGLDTRLRAGEYQLRRNMTLRQIGAALYRGRSAQLMVMVPPGWRMEQLADHLTANEVMNGELFLQAARAGTVVNHPLLADRPPDQSYEGYLFPGTYPLPDKATPADLIARMLENMAGHLPANVLTLARQRGLTFYQAITLASIVERETAIPAEKPFVASVYLNRLKAGSSQPLLQADPTVQYALGYQFASDQWWKTPVSLEEYAQVNSPYNTYLYPGLPPGPIASPGLDSIMAVLQPAQTDYLFFVCQQPRCEGGQHVFATSYEEHLQNVAVYSGY
ncbi:MAG: endolytic transglycosylase MltG [Anaerolineae bacterium]|nr:endolytic transglycosylase MltG [Anaerolineae bacterium]